MHILQILTEQYDKSSNTFISPSCPKRCTNQYDADHRNVAIKTETDEEYDADHRNVVIKTETNEDENRFNPLHFEDLSDKNSIKANNNPTKIPRLQKELSTYLQDGTRHT